MTITVTISDTSWAAIQADAAAIAGSAAPSSGGSGTSTTGGTSTGGTTTSGGGTTTPPVSTQAYPLTMPAGISGGAAVTLGTGPDTIQMATAMTPGITTGAQFLVILNQGSTQTAIAGPLTVSSDAGESLTGDQVFTLKGDFAGATGIEIVATGNGINGLWINQFLVNDIPWWINQDAANSRGTGTAVYQTNVFNSNGTNMTFLPQSAIPAQPIAVPAPTLTQISGATIGGAAQSAATLASLVAATATGETLLLPAGTIVGTAEINTACTVSGAGMSKTIIDCTDLPPYSNKAVLVPSVAGVTISDVTIQGASISASLGNNAAGVRELNLGAPFTLNSVEITGCQDGILAFADNNTLLNGHTHDNGAGDGFTHEIYLNGTPSSVETLTGWTSTCGTLSTHALKTRSGKTLVTGGTFTGSADPTGKIGGSVIDVPDAGIFDATGATMVVSAGAANTLFFGYGMESANNAATGTNPAFTNCVFTDNSGTGGQFTNGTHNPGAVLTLTGCTYTGTKAPQFTGWASVVGTLTKA